MGKEFLHIKMEIFMRVTLDPVIWKGKEFINFLTEMNIMVNGKMIKVMGKGNIFSKMATLYR